MTVGIELNGVSADIVSSRYDGVYMIWYFDASGIARTVRVGAGCIRERLEAARRDPEVQRYAGLGLYATWVLVRECHRESVADSLSQKLQPFVGAAIFRSRYGCFRGAAIENPMARLSVMTGHRVAKG